MVERELHALGRINLVGVVGRDDGGGGGGGVGAVVVAMGEWWNDTPEGPTRTSTRVLGPQRNVKFYHLTYSPCAYSIRYLCDSVWLNGWAKRLSEPISYSM